VPSQYFQLGYGTLEKQHCSKRFDQKESALHPTLLAHL